MYLAELSGKLPSNLESAEDLLTSNVFSFLKYTNRHIYLKRFLELLGVNVFENDLDNAEFQLWPCYPDGTEPDVVLIVGQYYILVEAKYGSGFGEETNERSAKRESTEGLNAASELGKEFILVALTADSTFMKWKAGVPVGITEAPWFRWINWQSISRILLNLLSSEGEKLYDLAFASDLIALLDKKNLRGFQSFHPPRYNYKSKENIFFSFATAKYRGRFIGFKQLMRQHVKVKRKRQITRWIEKRQKLV